MATYRPPHARARAGTKGSPEKYKKTSGPFTNAWNSSGNAPMPRRHTTYNQNGAGGQNGYGGQHAFAHQNRWAPIAPEHRNGSTFSQDSFGSGTETPHGSIVSSGSGPGTQGTQRGSASSTSSGPKTKGRVVNIRQERDRPGSNPLTPTFIPNSMVASYDHATWFNSILPQLAATTFVMESGEDVQWLKQFLTADYRFPQAYRAITKVSFPNFHWFSGVSSNRTQNPYIVTAAHLNCLGEITLNFHTAGLTVSVFGEKERMQLEQQDLRKSKELRPLAIRDVVAKYGLVGLFMCTNLNTINLTCIDSDIVAYFCKTSNPTSVVHEIAEFIKDGFLRRQGKAVFVNVEINGANEGQPAQEE